jgi:hypothetical protein
MGQTARRCAFLINLLPVPSTHPTLFKKYLPFSNSKSIAVEPTEQCPPELWTTAADVAALNNPSVPGAPVAEQTMGPVLTQAEQTQLHVRVIALENLVIALLASATDHQLECAREMAAYISPRRGATPHPLTMHAAAEMLSLVERATHFRGTTPK